MIVWRRIVLLLGLGAGCGEGTAGLDAALPADAGSPPADAAPDAAAPDAAALDAAAPDAAPIADAAVADVDLPDADVPDVGVDAAAPDAAPLADAEVLDAEVPDAGGPREAEWFPLAATTPNGHGRWGATLTHVPTEGRFLLFGGTVYPRTAGDRNELWSIDAETHAMTLLAPSGDTPAPRYCHCATYLPATHELLVVGGRNAGGPLAPFAATYSIANNRWAAIAGTLPAGVIGCSVVWMPDLQGGRAVVFGGGGRGGFDRRTYLYDPATRVFSTVTTTVSPSERNDAMATYDPVGRRMLVFGGAVRVVPPYQHRGDLWAFDGVRWTALPLSGPAPSPRRYMAGGFDARTSRWILFGGTDERTSFADTYAFEVGADRFTALSPSTSPPGRAFAAADLDAAGRLLVFGGLDTPTLTALADGWRLEPGR